VGGGREPAGVLIAAFADIDVAAAVVLIVAVLVAAFVLLIAIVRPPSEFRRRARWRVGVFFERDHEFDDGPPIERLAERDDEDTLEIPPPR
jgi:hypothetical protein